MPVFPKHTTSLLQYSLPARQLCTNSKTLNTHILYNSSDDADVPKLHTLHPVSTILILIYILVGTRYLYIVIVSQGTIQII